MNKEVLVLIEKKEGNIEDNLWGTIGFAKKLAERYNFQLKVVIIGNGQENLATQISLNFETEVLCISDKSSKRYTPEVYCDLFFQVIRLESPFLVIMGHTYRTSDFAPKLATMLDRGFVANCSNILIEEGRVQFIRPVFGGKLYQQVALKGDPPYLASLQRRKLDYHESTGQSLPKLVNADIHVSEKLVIKRKFLEFINGVKDDIDLSKAEIIVACGRGVGSKDNINIIQDLAKAFGASVGATRPVVDEGWLPKGHQVGTSGQMVAPRLYVACGISGAIQHLIGMNNAECIVAINKDPYAPIFRVADYGIVGDIFGVVPVLTQILNETKD